MASKGAPNKTQFNGAGGSRAYIDCKRIGDQLHLRSLPQRLE